MGRGTGQSFAQTRDRIDTLRRRRRQLGLVLPSVVVDMVIPEEKIEELEARREQVRDTFESNQESLQSRLTGVEARLSEARSAADPFAIDLTAASERLNEAESAVRTLEELDDEFLTGEEQDRRAEIQERRTALETELAAFEVAGREVQAAQTALNAASTVLEDYGVETWTKSDPTTPPSTCPQYLTTPAIRSVTRELAVAARHIATGFEEIRTNELGTQYLDTLETLRDERQALDTFVDSYNQWFLDQETDTHEGLFTDIDPEGHDLLSEQQAAVVHDDKYNLVVAGAGSGKTVTLTHRAAYLTRRNDRVLPDDILGITYTRNAAEVMESRLADRFGIDGVDMGTFHSIGLEVIEEVEGRRPEIATESDQRGIIRDALRPDGPQIEGFRREFTRFLRHYYQETESPDQAEKQEQYQELVESSHQTLRGETVRSESEKRIADFLFEHGISYEYRQPQEWFESAKGAGQFRPTFHLPEFDVVILHHPVTPAGEPTDWAEDEDSAALVHRLDWERTRLAENPGVTTVETYEFEHQRDHLPAALRDRLPAAGVLFDPLSTTDLIEKAYDESVNQYQIISLFKSFISNAKQLNLSPDELDRRVERESGPKQEAFEECARRLFRHYVTELDSLGAIDFADMLHRAAEYMESNPEPFTSRYEQVLVDEFQDISAGEVRLLKCFVTPENDTHLFCVGDDWQSIYSFSGSDVSYFIDFADEFDTPTRSDLTGSHRCPETVVAAGDALIAHNERQLAKETRPLSGRDTDIYVHDIAAAPGESDYEHEMISLTADLIEQRLDDGAPPSEILVLSRTTVYYDQLIEACAKRGIKASEDPGNEPNPEEYVRLYSVHKSKGDEARHVIIMHAVEDMIGFPSQVEDSALLEAVRLNPASSSEAEERRLFYVALTRTTTTLDITSAVGNRSRFLDEIDEYLTSAPTVAAVGDNASRTDLGSVSVLRLFDGGESVAQVGVLEDWSGDRKFTIFDSDETSLLTEDNRYQIQNARVDEYEGEYSYVLDGHTEVTKLSN